MKKVLILFVALLVVFSSACSSKGDLAKGDGLANEKEDELVSEIEAENSTNEKESEEKEEEKELVEEDNEEIYSLKDHLLLERDGYSFKVSRIEEDDIWGLGVKVECKNTSDEDVIFALYDVSVNGCMMDPYWGIDVPVDKTVNDGFNFSYDQLDHYGIELVEEIEFVLIIYDIEGWHKDIYLEELFTIYPTESRPSDINYFTYELKDGDELILDNEDFTFIITGVDPQGYYGYTVNTFAENKTDKKLMIAWDQVSINDRMVEAYSELILMPGKVAFGEVGFYHGFFQENNIREVEKIDFTLRVYDYEEVEELVDLQRVFSFSP